MLLMFTGIEPERVMSGCVVFVDEIEFAEVE
jgi:hypothetical protein